MNNYWKCLDCGAGEEGITFENLLYLDNCNRCGSKHLEAKVGDVHFVIIECEKCHKCKDVKYLNTSPGFDEKVAKDTAKQVWRTGNNLCTCSKSVLWWVLGIGAIVLITIGLIGYFWWKSNKSKKEAEHNEN